jgi:S1-C subfamily serine protease
MLKHLRPGAGIKSVLLFCLVLCWEQSCYSQDQKLLKDVLNKTARLIVRGTYQGRDSTIQGGGFIIGKNYVVTCYHVFKSSGFIPYKVTVLYNIQLNLQCDSVAATLDYEPGKGKYDFRTHTYKADDRESDVIVLKLANPVKSGSVKLSKSEIKVGDVLVTARPRYFTRAREFEVDIAAQTVTYKLNAPSEEKATQLMMAGYAQQGFSGSPLFNKKGEVVGITTAGYTNKISKEIIAIMKNKGDINAEKAGQLITELEKNPDARIGFCTSVNFLTSKYLKGYL